MPEKLISKRVPLKSEQEMYWPTWEIEPGSSDRLSRLVCTVSQSPEPPLQVCYVAYDLCDYNIMLLYVCCNLLINEKGYWCQTGSPPHGCL